MSASDAIARAERDLRTAHLLVEEGDYASSVPRCPGLPRLFYVARALLREKDSTPKTHSGRRNRFGPPARIVFLVQAIGYSVRPVAHAGESGGRERVDGRSSRGYGGTSSTKARGGTIRMSRNGSRHRRSSSPLTITDAFPERASSRNLSSSGSGLSVTVSRTDT